MTPEDVNRQRVAEHLADVLWEAGATTADDIANLEPFVWRLAVAEVDRRCVQQAIDCPTFTPDYWRPKPGYEPSDQTRVMVAGMIRYRERHTPIAAADPFEGLPT